MGIVEENKTLRQHIKDLESIIEGIRKDIRGDMSFSKSYSSNFNNTSASYFDLSTLPRDKEAELMDKIEYLKLENSRIRTEHNLKASGLAKREIFKDDLKLLKLEKLVDQFVDFFDRNVLSRKDFKRRYDRGDYDGMMDELDYINRTYGRERKGVNYDTRMLETYKKTYTLNK
jgi:hypothetical protein